MTDINSDRELHLADEGQRLSILGLFVGFIAGIPQLIFPIVAVVFGTRSSGNPIIPVVAVTAILFLSLFFRWIAWLRFRYIIGEHDIRIESGVLSRNARSIPYERIQDVSIEQKLLARVLGLGEVKFETGSGDGDDAKLSFVSVQEADRLRELVRSQKSGVAITAADAGVVEETDLDPIFEMDGQRVFVFGLYSFSLVIFAVLGGFAQQLDFLLPFDFWDFSQWIGLAEKRGVSVESLDEIGLAVRIVFGLGALGALIFIGFFTGVIRTFLREHGFRLDRTAKGFRRRRGLLTLTDAVMPAHRVQAAVIQTGPIRKRRGWHSLKFVSLAQDSKEETNFVAAPFATLTEIWLIARAAGVIVADDVAFRKGEGRWWVPNFFFAGLIVSGPVIALAFFTEATISQTVNIYWLLVPWAFLLWFERRNYRYAMDGSQIYVRDGWWRQRLTVAQILKIQTVEIAQGPIARRQGLASLQFGISGGTLEMVALPLETARSIRDTVIKQVSAVDYSAINRSP